MKLKTLLQGLPVTVKGSKETDVTGISSDSRTLVPGNLFLARKGAAYDGTQFIERALYSGAAALVTDIFDPFIKCPQIIHPNPASLEALLAARYYGHPSKKLTVIGVTGTKGKTTTSYLIHHLIPSGLASTVETIIGDTRHSSLLTTHDAITNQKLLKEMVIKQCKAAVLEVSSHGLEQGRVDEIDFSLAVFTNLYPDHLDYHQTMENYIAAKRKLFERAQFSILNADSTPMGSGLTYGIERGDLRAENICFDSQGTSFTIQGVPFCMQLIGKFNVYNALAAIAAAVHLGHSLESLQKPLSTFSGAPGRMQRIGNVFVDFAHTGEALENVLKTLKGIAKGKVIAVFGAGGDRDPQRRIGLAQAGEKYADISIVTTDNPRNEDPSEIARQMTDVFQNMPLVELDRKKAIFKAIEMAGKEDLVLIAGKGHQQVQIIGSRHNPFDDASIVKEALLHYQF